VYLPVCDTETGDFRMLPFQGSVMDQPCMSIQIVKLIKLKLPQSSERED